VILWLDGARDVVTQMERDRALLAAVESGHEPVLRLFRFDPPGITLGANQRPERELDLDACARDGVAWAIRPTGGRAIFHADEWTYAFASPSDDPEWGGSRAASYERISGLLAASLVRLGVPAELAHGARRPGDHGPRAAQGPSAPCFASTARHEVILDGRKLVGSAQRRTATGLLQQGSVLLGDGHLRLADYLPLPAEARERARAVLARVAVGAGRWIGADAAIERWAEAIRAGLAPSVRLVHDAPVCLPLTPAKSPPYTPAMPQVQA
jgi:lipoate-protein ligase A